jgi:hypothetical protein
LLYIRGMILRHRRRRTRLVFHPASRWPLAGALALALMASGCAGIEANREATRLETEGNVMPQNYRAEIVALMRTYLNDPTGVRGAFLSEPTIRTLGTATRYTVCLRYNPRKGGGQYAGSKDSIVTFWNGRLDRIIDNGREPCREAAYIPFPELERMAR